MRGVAAAARLLAGCDARTDRRERGRPALPAVTLADVVTGHRDGSCGRVVGGQCADLTDAVLGEAGGRGVRCVRPAHPDVVVDCRWEARFIPERQAADAVPWHKADGRGRWHGAPRRWCNTGPAPSL